MTQGADPAVATEETPFRRIADGIDHRVVRVDDGFDSWTILIRAQPGSVLARREISKALAASSARGTGPNRLASV